MRELKKEAIEDILHGATILGAGGGGPLVIGQKIAAEIIASGRPLKLADPDSDVPDEAQMAVSAVVGSPDATLDNFDFGAAPTAFKFLEEIDGSKLDFVLAGEVGAGNSLIPMSTAARGGIPVVDAAGARRAIPEFSMCTYASHNVPISPIAMANSQEHLRLDAQDPTSANNAIHGIISGGTFHQYVGVAFWTMSGKTMKQSAMLRTTTYAEGLGAALRKAKDPVQAVVEYRGGQRLFTGKVTRTNEETSGGFDLGYVVLKDQAGVEFWIYNQNENLMAWRSDQPAPVVMSPDLICYLTTDGKVFSNADLSIATDKEVAIIAAPSPKEMRADSIVQAFLDVYKTIGYAGPYTAFEPCK